jgi:hypothetical protein
VREVATQLLFVAKGRGITTFLIGHDGQVFESDLGPQTDSIVRAMKQFDPDSAWKEVPDAVAANP